jgi:hypothetical protein
MPKIDLFVFLFEYASIMSLDMYVISYSEKSFKVEGNDTKKYRQELKDLGGKYNPRLKGGPGWIFSNKRRASIEHFIESTQEKEEKEVVLSSTKSPKKEEKEDSEFLSEDDEDLESSEEGELESFDIGDKVAINTSCGGHQSWIFGKILRKTSKTMDLLLYNVEKEEITAGPGGYRDIVQPNWEVSQDKVKVWKSGSGSYWYEKEHLLLHFDSRRTYENCAYY